MEQIIYKFADNFTQSFYNITDLIQDEKRIFKPYHPVPNVSFFWVCLIVLLYGIFRINGYGDKSDEAYIHSSWYDAIKKYCSCRMTSMWSLINVPLFHLPSLPSADDFWILIRNQNTVYYDFIDQMKVNVFL